MAKRKTARKAHKDYWFKRVRGSYLPVNNTGLAFYFIYVAFLLVLMTGWYYNGHGTRAMLTVIMPMCLAAAFLMQSLASRHSR